jgi:hypothetical protein
LLIFFEGLGIGDHFLVGSPRTQGSENEQRLIHDLLLKNLDPDYKAKAMVMTQQP